MKVKIPEKMLWTSRIGTTKAMVISTGLRSASVKTKYLTHRRDLVEAEKLKPVIDRTYSIEQIAEAHLYVETGHKKAQ